MHGQAAKVDSALSDKGQKSPAAPAVGALEPKFQVPATRAGVVARTTLLERLFASDEPLITVVAPPGYGKTTLLAQWAERLGPGVAWVSCEKADNDPVAFWTAVITALDQIAPVSPAASQLLAASGGGVDVIPSLVSTFGTIRGPMVLVLDHAEAVTSRECRTSIAEFALRVPKGWRLAMASRDPIPIPTARLRVQGRIVEIGTTELAMARNEASELVRAAGVELADSRMDELLQRTEGWPAGLYLAALALRESSPAEGFTFTGDDRLMGDYLRSELLSRVSSSQASFFMRTSVLERMSGPLCDAVLGGKGSARVLEQLVSRNLLVVPLDHGGEWYRYHHILRELLQTELRRNDPDLVPELHSRAAVWYESNGMPEIAVDHAQAAGDADRVAGLVASLIQPTYAAGRVDTASRWLAWFEDQGLIDQYPPVAVFGAWVQALVGKPAGAQRWADAAERPVASAAQTPPDGSTMESYLAMLRGLLCRNGVGQMRADAQVALAGLAPASPFRTTALLLEGVAALLDGQPDQADPILAQAVELGTRTGILNGTAAALAERCLVAIGRQDWTQAETLADQALGLLETGRLNDYFISPLVHTVAARTALHRGDLPRAQEHLVQAAGRRPLLTYAVPSVAVQTLLELGWAYLMLDDAAGARTVLRQARGILQLRPDLGVLPNQAEELQAKLETLRGGVAGVSTLTTAELRLVPLLATHLNFLEIGQRLYISKHTAKSQAASIYRKLGASSRSEVVQRLQEIGLLEE